MLLALDTSTRSLGIALYDGLQVPGEAVWTCTDHHTVQLAPAVQDVLKKAGIKIDDVQALAVALGPGSFTGLRIGLALVKGLALARNLPVVGVPTLDFMAASQPAREIPLIAVLQAGRGRLAAGRYELIRNRWQPAGEIFVTNAEQLAAEIQSGSDSGPTWVCGELTEEERRVLRKERKTVLLATPAQSVRRPSFLAEIGWQRWQAGKVDDPAALAPIYLHYRDTIPG